MGYFSDMLLSYTNEDAEQDRRDGLQPLRFPQPPAAEPTFWTESYYAVTNGDAWAYWDNRRGCWNSKGRFEPVCLLDEESAKQVAEEFNEELLDDEPRWAIKA